MLKITSEADLLRLNPKKPALPILQELVQRLITETRKTAHSYDPENDGYLVLVDESDTERALTEIWPDGDWGLLDIPFEGVTLQDGFYIAVYLANNQFGIVFVVPENIVHGELLDCFEAHLDE